MASGVGVTPRPGFAFRDGSPPHRRTSGRPGRCLPVGRTQRRGYVDLGVRAFLAPPVPPRASRCRRLPRRAGGTDLAAAGGVGSRRAGADNRTARTGGRAGVVDGGARLDRRPERERSPPRPCRRAGSLSTSRATAWPRSASRGAIPTSSPRRSWRGERHGPPKVSSEPAGRWDPGRRSISTIFAVAPKTPACGPRNHGSGRRNHQLGKVPVPASVPDACAKGADTRRAPNCRQRIPNASTESHTVLRHGRAITESMQRATVTMRKRPRAPPPTSSGGQRCLEP